MTDSQLLDGVGTLRAITRSSSSIRYSKNAALEAIVFFYWHACCSERSIAFKFRRSQNIRQNSVKIGRDHLKVATKNRVTQEHATKMRREMGLDQHQKAIKTTHIQRSPIILPGRDRAKTGAHSIGKKNRLHLMPVHLLVTRIHRLLCIYILRPTRCALVITIGAGEWDEDTINCVVDKATNAEG